MQIGKYHFSCVLESDAYLPGYKGSTFRGVFGRALKKVVCVLRLQTCDECLLKEQCLYTQLFESATLPRPFVIEPPLDLRNEFPAGSSFNFALLLFGHTNKKLPYFVYAFREMGNVGIGRRINGQRGRFSLEAVSHEGRVIYEKKEEKIFMPDVPDIGIASAKGSGRSNLAIRVSLVTPLRIKYRNRLSPDLPFHVLTRAVLRRISSLYQTYGEGEPLLDYKGLINKAQSITSVENDLYWFDWRRYSFRQEKGMLMGGLVGGIVYEGDIAPYLPLLQFCEMAHLGKQTSFGLGKIRVEVLE